MPRSIIKYFLLCLILPVVLTLGCINTDADADVLQETDDIYFDYQVRAQEGDDKLIVFLQFREYDEEGDAFTLPANMKIMFDGQQLVPDSSNMTGSYYEAYFPTIGFAGDHMITLVHGNKKEEISFHFSTLSLSQLPDTIKRNELHLKLDVPEGSLVRVLLIDTVFENNGINRLDSIHNGILTLNAEELAGLAVGPVQMELILEHEKELRTPKTAGGRLAVSYSLRREFILVD